MYLKSLLRIPGLSLSAYQHYYGSDPLIDFPDLGELEALGFASCDGDLLALTTLGMGYSDVIGPWLASTAVSARMEAFDLQ